MWDKIKKLLGIEEPLAKEDIRFDELDEWFKAKNDFVSEVLKEEIALISQKIAEEKGKALQNLQILSEAQLQNPNVPERALNFMKGNREIYLKKTSMLLDKVNMPGEIASVIEFCNMFSKELDEFGKSTIRPYAILQEFFANEARDVAANLKYLAKHTVEIRELVKTSRYAAMAVIKEDIDELHKKIRLSRQILGSMHEKQKLKEMLDKKQAEIEKKRKEIESSGDYVQLKKDEVELKEVVDEIRETKLNLEHPFSVMDAALRKYHRIAYKDKELLGKYIESPLETLSQDIELKILEILEKMRQMLEEEKIDIKDMKKHKTLVAIKNLDKSYLSKFLADYGRVKKREADVLERIGKNSIRQDIKKIEEEMKINNSMVSKCDSDLKKLDEDLNKIDISALKKKLKDDIKEKLRIEISFR